MNKIQSVINSFLHSGQNDDCLRELVQEHYSKIYLTTAISFFGLSLIGYVNWIVSSPDQKNALVVWMGFIALLTVIRLTLVLTYNNHQIKLDNQDKLLDPIPWAKWEIFCCGFFGAIVGSVFFIIYEGGLLDNFAQVQIVTMVVAMTIAGGGFLAVYLPCYISFAFCSAILVVVKVLLVMDISGLIGLLIIGGFHFLVYGFSKSLNRKFREPIELRLQGMELIENLARSNDQYKESNNLIMSIMSLVSSNLKSDYLQLLSKVQGPEAKPYECNKANDEIRNELFYLENTSMLVGCIVDSGIDEEEVRIETLMLTDFINQLPDELKKIASNIGIAIEHTGDDLIVKTNRNAFYILIRCLVSNLIRSQSVHSTIFVKGLNDNNEVQIFSASSSQQPQKNRASYQHDSINLLRRLSMILNISILDVSDSENCIGYRLIFN